MTILERKPQPAKGRSTGQRDPALEEFRAQMGAWAEGRTDLEVAQLKAFLDMVAQLALATARKQA